MIKPCALALLSAVLHTPAGSQDRTEVERTQILGNRELPKVLYIVPWKQPVPSLPDGKPLRSVLDETLTPVDRAVFRRQVEYGVLRLQPQLAARTQPPTNPDVPPGETR